MKNTDTCKRSLVFGLIGIKNPQIRHWAQLVKCDGRGEEKVGQIKIINREKLIM